MINNNLKQKKKKADIFLYKIKQNKKVLKSFKRLTKEKKANRVREAIFFLFLNSLFKFHHFFLMLISNRCEILMN